MPKVKGLTPEQKIDYQREKLADRCDVLLYENHVSRQTVAEYVGISPQAICKQFKTKRLSTEVLIAVITLTDAGADKLKEMLTVVC